MNQTYQINRAAAVKRFQQLVAEHNPAGQLVFPLAEMLSHMRAGLSSLVIELGRQFFEQVMQAEVTHLAGPHGQRGEADREHTR